MALLRTAQEALANVAQHAAATRAGVTLSFMGDVVTLDVRDDGIGFEPERGVRAIASGFGLTGDAAAGRPRGRVPGDRIGAGRRARPSRRACRRSAARAVRGRRREHRSAC